MAVVKLKDVVEELTLVSNQTTAYLNRRTGELYLLTSEELRDLDAEDDEEEIDDEPEWLREARTKAREVTGSDDWLELPDSFEIHEYQIMQEFCESILDERISQKLLNAIRGSGAFRRFKDAISLLELEDAWYQFRDSELERIAIDWLEEHDIPYSQESQTEERSS
jgi:hypothetical protein